MTRPSHGKKSEYEKYIDYMAATILMPKDSVVKDLNETNFFQLDTKEKRKIVLEMAEHYQIEDIAVLKRIREVRILDSN